MEEGNIWAIRCIGESMKTNIIMVGMDHWEDFTLPAILSFQKHEPDANIILVDHGVNPYPETEGVEIIRLDRPAPYSVALNIGISHDKADWYFITNNDVLCEGPFIQKMRYDVIYANKTFSSGDNFWFDNCFVFISHLVWSEVGEFDEKFLMAAFEDADYSFRAQEKGFHVSQRDMPFQHFEGTTRTRMADYSAIRFDNLVYLQNKYPERSLAW